MDSVSDFPSKQLLKDLIEWSISMHAQQVYNKCLRLKKYALAQKIARKYGLKVGHSDLVIAMGIAMGITSRPKDD